MFYLKSCPEHFKMRCLKLLIGMDGSKQVTESTSSID